MPPTLTIVGNEMFVITRHVNALHMLWRTEPDQHAFAVVEAKHRLVVQNIGHRSVWRRLSRNGSGVCMAKTPVNT
ncbi:hypothetical protein D3C80_863550 [compost metagenome]